MVRGSTLRVTGLRPNGAVPSDTPISCVVSRSTIKVTLDEVTDDQSDQTLRDEVDQPRIHLAGSDDVVGYGAGIDFLRVDPDLLSLLTGVPVALDAAGNAVGFDAQTKLPVTSFGLEVWSKLSGPICADGQKWGYTLFPLLRGGYLSGLAFDNALVSFSIVGAMTGRGSLWNVGPHDLEGQFERLLVRVSGNDSWITGITGVPPPEQTDGIVTFEDRVRNGTATDPMPDPDAPVRLIGGTAASTSPWIVSGGRA
jgi:hypothetical protein